MLAQDTPCDTPCLVDRMLDRATDQHRFAYTQLKKFNKTTKK